MSNIRRISYLFGLAWLGLSLCGCGSPAPTAEPDLVATGVAVEKAIAATLTAEATAVAGVALTPTPSPTGQELTAIPATNTAIPTEPVGTSPQPPTPEAACTVVAASLNLRNGPGVAYAPPIGAIQQGTNLKPLAFIANGHPGGQWIQVQVPANNQTGWVSADLQFVTCNIDPTSLTPGTAPATPTLTNTPPPAQPTYVTYEPAGGGNDDLQGQIVFPGFTAQELDVNNQVFRDRLVFQVEVRDITVGTADGAGIDNVDITITRDSDGFTVHQQTETTAGYCVFGGGEPNCTVWVFAEHNNRWPDGEPIIDGGYSVSININAKSGDNANWNWNFEIDCNCNPPQAGLTAQIVQTGPGTTSPIVNGALVFQVQANNPAVGNYDGAGIARVDLFILDSNGSVIYHKEEVTASYCAFSGGEPDCNIWDFAGYNHLWPNNQPINTGNHTLHAIVYAQDGQSTTVETTINIQTP